MTKRQIAALFASAFLVALISLPLVACGGDGAAATETPAPTDVPRTTCKPAEPVVLSTPTDLPPGLAEYQSPERGYRVRYPSDWEVQPNQIALGNMAGDVFFSPTAIGEIKPNISVSCETDPRGNHLSAVCRHEASGYERGLRREPIRRNDPHGGRQGCLHGQIYGQRVRAPPEPLTVDKIDIFFADDLGGWTLTLVAPEGATGTYWSALDAFVRSFHRP